MTDQKLRFGVLGAGRIGKIRATRRRGGPMSISTTETGDVTGTKDKATT